MGKVIVEQIVSADGYAEDADGPTIRWQSGHLGQLDAERRFNACRRSRRAALALASDIDW